MALAAPIVAAGCSARTIDDLVDSACSLRVEVLHAAITADDYESGVAEAAAAAHDLGASRAEFQLAVDDRCSFDHQCRIARNSVGIPGGATASSPLHEAC